MLKRFVIYAFAGWCGEIIFTGMTSLLKGDPSLTGKTYIWMFFVYGLAVFLEPVHDQIRSAPVIVRGGIYMVLIFTTEYLTGWILNMLIGQCPWDYGNSMVAYRYIRLDFMPIWFFAGLLFEKLHDSIRYLGLMFGEARS